MNELEINFNAILTFDLNISYLKYCQSFAIYKYLNFLEAKFSE